MHGKHLALFFGLLLLCLPPPCLAEEQEPAPCVTLLRNKCEECHYNTRFCQKLEKKSKRAWKRSIRTMIDYGVELTAAEQKFMLRCLHKPADEVKNYCRNP
jgi:hypothetical protein